MSDTTTTMLGLDAQPIIDAFEKAEATAEAVRSEELLKIDEPYDNVRNGLSTLFGRWSTQYDTINTMVSLLTHERRIEDEKRRDTVWNTYNEAVEKAQKARNNALGADPLTKFVNEVVRRQHGSEYADVILALLPATIEDLKTMANEQGWCTSFEEMMHRAHEKGLLPKIEPITVTEETMGYDVPTKYNPQPNERWERIATVPGYIRTADRYGNAFPIYRMDSWLLTDEYRKVEKKEDTTTED